MEQDEGIVILEFVLNLLSSTVLEKGHRAGFLM